MGLKVPEATFLNDLRCDVHATSVNDSLRDEEA